MKISYNWLKWYVPQIPEIQTLADAIIFYSFEVDGVEEKNGDYILDIKTLPDRNHDCLSHYGIAKEISVILDIPFVSSVDKYKIPESKKTELSILVESPVCRRYVARVIHGVKVGPSPSWIVDHLASIGQRSINNLVDATNIVMFNLGQPCHVFDYEKIKKGIVVREAKEGEKINLLSGEEKTLTGSMTIISDGEGSALAVAGVKGGTYAEVDIDTKDIVIEVANFAPVETRRTARALGIQTDATKRFENDLSPVLAEDAMKELSSLILEMCGNASFEDIVDVYKNPQNQTTITISQKYICQTLGHEYSMLDIESVWKRLAFSYEKDGDAFKVTPSLLRLDITSHQNLVEEVGRILGYEKIKPVIPVCEKKPQINIMFYQMLRAKEILSSRGYFEVMTYTFCKKGIVKVSYGAKGKEYLRTNLSDGLKESYEMNRLNAPLLGLDEVKLFEVGTVFREKDKEEIYVAWIDKNGVNEENIEEFAKEKEIIVSESYDAIFPDSNFKLSTFKPWSAYPFITRDIALWVPKDIESTKVSKIIKENAGDLLLGEPRLFDQFEKDDKKSYAFRLVFQSKERTLTDEEIVKIISNITAKILENKDWLVR